MFAEYSVVIEKFFRTSENKLSFFNPEKFYQFFTIQFSIISK